jgi:hypothetical protein
MQDMSSDPIATLAYESTERGEVLASFARRFHEWPPNDRRWPYVQVLWALLETTETPGVMPDRPARMAAAVLDLADTTDTLLAEGAEVRAATLGAILNAARLIEQEASAFLADVGAGYQSLLREELAR